MLKDITENIVEGVHVAITKEIGTLGDPVWNAYIINKNEYPLENVLIMSNGYGMIEGVDKKTSTLRNMIDAVLPKDHVLIEPVDPITFGLTTVFNVTYYRGRLIHDAKFVFKPHEIQEDQLIYIKGLDKKGIVASI